MIRRWEASSPPHPLSGAFLPRQERVPTPGTIAVLRQDILLTPVLRRTSDLTQTRPTPAEIGGTGTEVGTTSVAEIMIAIGDVVVAEVEIEDVAEAESEGVTGVVTETVTGIENLIEIGKLKRRKGQEVEVVQEVPVIRRVKRTRRKEVIVRIERAETLPPR